jgi:MFS family permease
VLSLPHSRASAPEIFKFSDRYGRVKFLRLNITTLLLSDAALAALAIAPEYVPGGYWLILVTSALEGLVGGGFRPLYSTT